MTALLSPEELKSIIEYNPETGEMTWRIREPSSFSCGKQSAEHNCAIWNGRIAGTPALSFVNNNGYLSGSACGRSYKAHRVAWAIYYGEWPKGDIDHVNRVRTDNRISNLRSATRSENLRNTGILDRNTSGVTGVSWAAERGQWNAKIGHRRKQINLGYFAQKKDAVQARLDAEIRIWGKARQETALAAQGVEIILT